LTEPTRVIVWILVSYLLGAVPTSYLVARLFKGIDLREQGSRNLGATNLYRTLGWKYAVPVGLFDVAKGALPVVLLGPLVPEIALFPVYCGVAAILGHVFSVFRGLQGRQGRRHRRRRRPGTGSSGLARGRRGVGHRGEADRVRLAG
jgi:acyl-phosphate glycerol 3-phosphate acyltransferase